MFFMVSFLLKHLISLFFFIIIILYATRLLFAVIMRQRLLRFAACVAVLLVHGDKAVRTLIDV